MEIYEQGTDVELLTSLLSHVSSKLVIDAGAERGGFTQAFLKRGAERVYAIEPYPPNAAALADRFGDDPRVTILPLALGDSNSTAVLHLIEERQGGNASSYHSLARASDTEMLHTVGELAVPCRMLASLVEEGALPGDVGILKIDAEGHDFAILRGMGSFTPAAVMIEFWDDLPGGVGRRQFALAEVWEHMTARGYSHVVIVKRHDEFETIEINGVETRPGDWGNAIFLHGRAFPAIPAHLFAAAAAAHARLIDKAAFFKRECGLRLQVIEEQSAALARQAELLKPAGLAERLRRVWTG